MPRLPRLAVGTIQPGVDSTPLVWALTDALECAGWRVQNFLSRACFTPRDGATVITGHAPRHLDSWLMAPEVCRNLLWRGMAERDLALIEGSFVAGPAHRSSPGGQLDTLCEWLDLPRLAIVDVAALSDCQLPPRPENVCGLLLDRVGRKREFFRLQTKFESLWNIPVLGGLDELSPLRAELQAIPAGSKPPASLCRSLGDCLRRRSDLERIRRLAAERDFSHRRPPAIGRPDTASWQVAVAYDDAFHCYFPDTLDLLEAQGAVLSDFSPLHDERLPPGTDMVYLGCGRPDRFARELVENHCLIAALHEHVCRGRRMYAECGGLAYLCEHIELPDGSRCPMAGILPAVARLANQPPALEPVELGIAGSSWLAPAGAQLKGYLNSSWTLAQTGPLNVLCGAGHGLDLVGRHQAIGSRVHFNFAADLPAAERFFLRGPAPAEVIFELGE